MQGVYEYGDGIAAVDTQLVRPIQTAVHLIVENGRAGIVDVPSEHCVPRLIEALAGRGIAPEQVDFVFLTHVHMDHAGGAGQMMARCPNARLAVHPRGARHMIDPARLVQATVDIYGAEKARRLYGAQMPVPAERVVETPDGTVLELAGRAIRFLETPGHARHHVVLHDQGSGGVFAGDTFGLSYRELDRDGRQFAFPSTTPSQFDPEALHASIERIVACRPGAVYVAHFGRVGDVPRLAADLHRIIDAHVALARRERDAGAGRPARLAQGVRQLVLDEARRQHWSLDEEGLTRVFELDIELNAQGLDTWLGAGG